MPHENPLLDALWLRVCSFFDEWVELLNLSWIDITLVRNDGCHAENDAVAADTTTKWHYRQAMIRVYLAALATSSDKEIENVIVHELAHVLVNSMEDKLPAKYEENCELAVENIARALVDVRNASRAS